MNEPKMRGFVAEGEIVTFGIGGETRYLRRVVIAEKESAALDLCLAAEPETYAADWRLQEFDLSKPSIH